jgi:tol-pal system protein YbgF
MMISPMTFQGRLRTRLAILAGVAALALAAAAPAAAAPSRAELEASVINLENTLAEALTRLRSLEEQVTGGANAESVSSQIESLQAELVRVVGELEESQYQNARLREQVRALHREIQLRDAEIAAKLGLEPAFTAPFDDGTSLSGVAGAGATDPFTNPFLQANNAANNSADPALTQAAGSEGAAGAAPAETDPSFFGEDPFAQQRAASMGTLGVRAPLPDDPQAALDQAKRYLIDGRYDEAEAAFAEFQQRFSETPQAAEALYWQGESRYVRGAYEEAKDLYIASLRADPAGPRAADAMIALASSLQNMNLTDEACNTLASFPRQYPNAALSVRSKAERVRQAAGCR